MITIERIKMQNPTSYDNVSVEAVESVHVKVNCDYEIEDGKVARIIYN